MYQQQPPPVTGYPVQGSYPPQGGYQQPPPQFNPGFQQPPPQHQSPPQAQPLYEQQPPPPQPQYHQQPPPQHHQQPPPQQFQQPPPMQHQPPPPQQQGRTLNEMPCAGKGEAPLWTGGEYNETKELEKCGFSIEEIQEARAEHGMRQLDFCASGEEVTTHMGGHGMFMLFEFTKYIGVVMCIVMVLQIINYATFAGRTDRDLFEGFSLLNVSETVWYQDFFVSTYSKDDKDMWLAMNIISLVIAFVMAPLYIFYVGWRWPDDLVVTTEHDDQIIRFNKDGTIDVSDHYRTFGDLFLRRAFSGFIFFLFLALQGVASSLLTNAQSSSTSIVVAVVVSLVLIILNASYEFATEFLTEFEKHMTMSAVIRWSTLKLFLFKVANLICVYAFKSFNAPDCVYNLIGQQFLVILVLDMVFIPIGIAVAMLWANFHQLFAKVTSSINSDARNMPQFVITTEYLKIVYRLFVVFAAMIVFPLGVCIGVVVLFLDFWAAKFRLFKICGRPVTISSSMRMVLAIGLFLAAIAALLMPNAGAAFVLSGWTNENRGDIHGICAIP